jgi:hypothetical protein
MSTTAPTTAVTITGTFTVHDAAGNTWGPIAAPTPPPLVASQDGATASDLTTILVTADLCQWKLAVGTASQGTIVTCMPKGAAAFVAAGFTGNVRMMEAFGGGIFHTSPNASSYGAPGWWAGTGTGSAVAWAAVPGSPSAVPVPPVTGTFTVTATGFTDPSGKPWTMRGVNAWAADARAAWPNIRSQFPHLTAIRLNCDSATDTPASIVDVVTTYTGAGIVLIVEDHGGNVENLQWYHNMATAYKNNPRVFLEMPNEPSASNLAAEQIALIQQIRNAGFVSPIAIQPSGGWDEGNLPAVVAAVGTTNLYATPHIYYNGTDPNGAAQYVTGEINGAAAVGLFASIDEFGDGMDGWHEDPLGSATINAVIAANQAGRCGAAFWALANGMHADGVDSVELVADCSQLTPVGAGPIKNWLG